ncbi:MAG: hypothetical protein K9N09_08480 [Candidatus Cloacimonetes bacterium]|nr:hypothetical protein [Candidatus Cloacimonadota bacterium]MCF7814131.1 hypothetical protein [Candidatus Cloacimonadota bacterium]MCF7868720.1 hypothetical protein [Candidatus Cloacimonadota bacterium]MCF7884130.1 hypothetical protein [Candidatus Cloacimonadota bacterium]
MAEVIFSMAEAMDFLAANKILPSNISNLEIDDNMVTFRYNTKLAFPSHIDMSIQFLKYENGVAELEIATSWLVEKVLKKIPIMQQDFLELQGSRLYIRVNELIEKKISRIRLENLEFINHRFEIKFSTI